MRIAGSVLGISGSGLPGVAVCDGRTWTTTAPDGSFTLETVPGRPVWLRRGPRWPGGQWWQHAASSPLVFRAEPGRSGGSSPDPATVRIGHLSDPHLTALDGDRSAVDLAARFGDQADTTAGLRNALAACADRGAAFAVITGDLTDHGTEEEFRRVTGTITAAPLPVEIVPGNHDHYGHQHQPRPGDTPRGAGFLGSATVTRYEQAMGPRWWSADLAGLHLIGLDWFSARCGIDPAEQQQFVTADLATRTPGLPVVVLAHDQPDDETLALIHGAAGPPGLLAVLTGHWHATAERVTGGCHFLSTPAACFGGLDWSPPQLRMITIDAPGGEVRLQHAEIPVAPADQGGTGQGRPRHRGPAPAVATARRKLGTRQHLGTLATVSGTVVAATTDASGAGWLSCVHPGQGTLWTMRAAAEPIGGLLAARGRILASGTTGTIVAVDPATGEPHWAYELPARHRRRVLAAPVATRQGQVIAGDVGAVACLDIESGRPQWQILSPDLMDTLLTYGTGLATGDHVVLPFGGPTRGLTALRLSDGSVAWTDPPGTPAPSSSLVPIGDGDALLIRTSTPTLERLELATGQLRWRTTIDSSFSSAGPAVTGDAVVLVTGQGACHLIDPGTGTILHRHQLTGLRDAYGPYRTAGTGAPTAPVLTPRGPVITLLDGSVWLLADAGDTHLIADVSAPVTTQPITVGGHILAILSTDATLSLIDLDTAGRPG